MIHSTSAVIAAALMLVVAGRSLDTVPSENTLLRTFTFNVGRPAEAIATLTAKCDACAWDVEGREAVILTIVLDGRAVSHLPLVRSGRADYPVLLGPVNGGAHTLAVKVDLAGSADELDALQAATIEGIAVKPTFADDPQHTAISLAPILYARSNTIGRFTDVPLFMWYEREPTSRGVRYRYSVIFTNEDGGTPTDRLMATWGRTTDIEYVYSVELDSTGTIIEDDLQGPEHAILRFAGAREGRHPLLWVSTDNNMVRDTGSTNVRYALAPVLFALNGVSREAVMDANPWLYAVASQELVREGKIVEGAPAGKGTIPDPRQFVYVEACGTVGTAALSFEVAAGGTWIPSDRGVPQYTIVRDGCVRAAVPMSPSTKSNDLRALRVLASPRISSNGSTAVPPSPVRIDKVNRVFMLDERYAPQRSILEWRGPATVTPGAPLEITIP